MKLGQNVSFDEISDEIEIGSCRVKTWSLDQILEKSCEHSRSLCFCPLLIKVGKKVCLDEFSDKFKIGSGLGFCVAQW